MSAIPLDEKLPQPKLNLKGLVLVPQPSNDPHDPLVSIQANLQLGAATDLPTTELDNRLQVSGFIHCVFGLVYSDSASCT